jgi:hypothetical protein
MHIINQYRNLPILLLYVFSSTAEAIQTDTNDTIVRTSSAVPKELASWELGTFSNEE